VYQLVGDDERRSLRLERLAHLENDHYRMALQIEEATNGAELNTLMERQRELERRMNIHLGALSPPVPGEETRPEETRPDDPLPVSEDVVSVMPPMQRDAAE
jgi:hypothetical protein